MFMHFNIHVRLLTLFLVLWAFGVSADDQIRFGKPVKSEFTESPANVLPLLSGKPPRELANDAEVILISGYEPSNVSIDGAKVKVIINRPKSKVLLVLTSYSKIVWEIEASPQTKIAGIVTAGHESPPTIVTTAQTVGYLTKLPDAYETENSNFKALLTGLNQLFGITKIDAFRGNYSIPSLITISELERPRVELTLSGPMPQKPNVNFSFNLISTDFKNSKWSLSGSYGQKEKSYVDDGKVALSKAEDILYKLATNGIEIINIPENARRVVSIPSNFPNFSWAMDIALDTKRGIVTVVSLGGEGFLYRFDIKNNRWIDYRSLNNIDISSLAYDSSSDRYVGWADNGKLIFISGNGDALFSKEVIGRMPGFGRVYDRGNRQAPRITIAPNGNDIALIYISGNVVSHIWYYSLLSESALLTYQSENSNVPIP